MKTDYKLELEIYEHFNALDEYFRIAKDYAMLNGLRLEEFFNALQTKQAEHFNNGEYECAKTYSEMIATLSKEAEKSYNNLNINNYEYC